MASIWTPAPESTVKRLKQTMGGRPADIVWAIFVTALLITLGILLVAVGGVAGAAVGAIALASVFSEAVREAIRDVYGRNFWVWRTD